MFEASEIYLITYMQNSYCGHRNLDVHGVNQYYTITLWFPCLDGMIQTRENVARVKKCARNHEPKASDFARFS